MKKIPTIYERDWAHDASRVTRKPTPALQRCVGATPTIKVDGTACMIRDGRVYKRYTVKGKRKPPAGFEPTGEPDPETGKQTGWVPVGDGPEDARHREALAHVEGVQDGTYELVGPGVQRNPYDFAQPMLLFHGAIIAQGAPDPSDFDALEAYLQTETIEGIVWWLDGAPVGKIKRRDFGLPWPV